jgi:hypothetical protein
MLDEDEDDSEDLRPHSPRNDSVNILPPNQDERNIKGGAVSQQASASPPCRELKSIIEQVVVSALLLTRDILKML